MELPGVCAKGLAMHTTVRPCLSATSLSKCLNSRVWSANNNGSPCSRLISNWLTPISCMKVSRGKPKASMQR
ncbi:hypothetical protein D3C75_1148280 [compost metagenome]